MRRGTRWALSVLTLCSLACTLYGALSLSHVQRQLTAGTTEVRLLLDTPKREERPAADSEIPPDQVAPMLNGEAEGLLCYADYEVAIFRGLSSSILTKGAGRVITGAKLNDAGNCILYGHRDSAFHFLQKVQIGDELRLYTPDGVYNYRVSRISIFSPDDPSIFMQTEQTTLSLVTCYPFTFVGPALQRCVVRAEVI